MCQIDKKIQTHPRLLLRKLFWIKQGQLLKKYDYCISHMTDYTIALSQLTMSWFTEVWNNQEIPEEFVENVHGAYLEIR